MLDIGWSELLLIGIVALIVVGPEDLPRMFRAFGRITARARAMAREFSRAMEDAARDSGLEDAGKAIRDVKSVTSKKSLGLDALDRAADSLEKWDPRQSITDRGKPGDRTAVPDPASPAPPATIPPATTPAEPADIPASVTGSAGRRQIRASRRSARMAAGNSGTDRG